MRGFNVQILLYHPFYPIESLGGDFVVHPSVLGIIKSIRKIYIERFNFLLISIKKNESLLNVKLFFLVSLIGILNGGLYTPLQY